MEESPLLRIDIFDSPLPSAPKVKTPACLIAHKCQLAKTHACAGNAFTIQNDINERFRGILVDWLFEVYRKFKMETESFFLCVDMVDRFLEVKKISRCRLQLVGIACLLIAGKYEEIYSPLVKDLVYVSAKAYTAEQILQMELTVLGELRYTIVSATPHWFLECIFATWPTTPSQEHFYARAYVFFSCQHYSCVQYDARERAVSCLVLARMNKLPLLLDDIWQTELWKVFPLCSRVISCCTLLAAFLLTEVNTHQLQAMNKTFIAKLSSEGIHKDDWPLKRHVTSKYIADTITRLIQLHSSSDSLRL